MIKQVLAFSTVLLLFLSLTACPSTKSIPQEDPSKGAIETVTNKIHATFKTGLSPDKLVRQLEEYKVTSKGPTSRSKNSYILTFDPSLIEPEAFLNKVRSAPAVLEADFLVQKQQ